MASLFLSLLPSLSSITNYDESGPVEWVAVFSGPEHLEGRPLQSLRCRDVRFLDSVLAVAMKLQHQTCRAGRLHLPLAHHRGRAARHKERPSQPDYPLARADPPAAGFARRENHHVGVQIEIHDLPRLQQPVLARTFGGLREHYLRV